MSQSYEFAKRMEQLHVDDIQFDEQGNIIFDDIQFDEQGNIIFDEFEQKERGSERWQDLEKKYGINFGDVVKIDDHLGRLQELHVSEFRDHNGVTLSDDRVYIKLLSDPEFKDFECSEIGMTAKEFLKDIKIQPREKEKKLSITEKIKNTIKTNVQTLKKTLKKGGAAQRLANRRTHEKATNTQTKPSASQSASQRLKNKKALQNTQGLER